MAVFGLFKRGFDPDLFEKELNHLSESINSTSLQITKLEIRYRQIKKFIIQWSSILYLAFQLYNFMKIPTEVIGKNKFQRFFKSLNSKELIFFFGFPIATYILIKIIKILFNFYITSRRKYLKTLNNKQKIKIDELKELTNYNKTKNLLNKFDETKPVKPVDNIPINRKSVNKSTPSKKASIEQKIKLELVLDSKNLTEPLNKPLNFPAPLAKPTVLDKILNLLIGSDNNESIEQRFALICQSCYSHNGLAPPGTVNPLYIKYMCYKCGFLNGVVPLDLKRNPSETDSDNTNKDDSTLEEKDNTAVEDNIVTENKAVTEEINVDN